MDPAPVNAVLVAAVIADSLDVTSPNGALNSLHNGALHSCPNGASNAPVSVPQSSVLQTAPNLNAVPKESLDVNPWPWLQSVQFPQG